MSRLVRGMAYPIILAFAIPFGFLTTAIRQADACRERTDPEKEPKAGEEREFKIAPGVKMKFCWVPSGEVQLGATKAERDAVLKQLIDLKFVTDGQEPEWLALEAAEVRGMFKTKGFWLGKYPVTQEEWKAVMRDNPSYFQPEGMGKEKLQKDKIQDTSRFPVDWVSWNNCQNFLEKLNNHAGAEKVFGKPGQFVLPHEDQWEYACRGGKGNDRAFYWGNELNGTEANCRGDQPFGTSKKGQYLERTCSVEFTSGGEYEKHPWGLCHMTGNVWQWCDNKYEQRNIYVLRGGSWYFNARLCRSASRGREPQFFNSSYNGFRIRFRLD
jgi:formylglycine-generating enzyme required for sulfatase activity